MANRKKYVKNLIRIEILRKKRLKKKLKRNKILAGRRKFELNSGGVKTKTPAVEAEAS